MAAHLYPKRTAYAAAAMTSVSALAIARMKSFITSLLAAASRQAQESIPLPSRG